MGRKEAKKNKGGKGQGREAKMNRKVDLVFSSWWNTNSLDSIVKLSRVPPSRNLVETGWNRGKSKDPETILL